MTLKERIKNDIKEAMRAKDTAPPGHPAQSQRRHQADRSG